MAPGCVPGRALTPVSVPGSWPSVRPSPRCRAAGEPTNSCAGAVCPASGSRRAAATGERRQQARSRRRWRGSIWLRPEPSWNSTPSIGSPTTQGRPHRVETGLAGTDPARDARSPSPAVPRCCCRSCGASRPGSRSAAPTRRSEPARSNSAAAGVGGGARDRDAPVSSADRTNARAARRFGSYRLPVLTSPSFTSSASYGPASMLVISSPHDGARNSSSYRLPSPTMSPSMVVMPSVTSWSASTSSDVVLNAG